MICLTFVGFRIQEMDVLHYQYQEEENEEEDDEREQMSHPSTPQITEIPVDIFSLSILHLSISQLNFDIVKFVIKESKESCGDLGYYNESFLSPLHLLLSLDLSRQSFAKSGKSFSLFIIQFNQF